MHAWNSKIISTRARCKLLEKIAKDALLPFGMRHQRTRLRKKEREGVVVDMVFTSEQLRFPVWHFRFKDCAEVSLDDVATEVGIAQGFGNRVAIIAGTGRTSNAARKYAALVNSKT